MSKNKSANKEAKNETSADTETVQGNNTDSQASQPEAQGAGAVQTEKTKGADTGAGDPAPAMENQAPVQTDVSQDGANEQNKIEAGQGQTAKLDSDGSSAVETQAGNPVVDPDGMDLEDEIEAGFSAFDNGPLSYEAARLEMIVHASLASTLNEVFSADDLVALADAIDTSGRMDVSALANILDDRYGHERRSVQFETDPEAAIGLTVFQSVYLGLKPLAVQSDNLFKAANVEDPKKDLRQETIDQINRLKRRERGNKRGAYSRRYKMRREELEQQLKKQDQQAADQPGTDPIH